jgi:trigger factor
VFTIHCFLTTILYSKTGSTDIIRPSGLKKEKLLKIEKEYQDDHQVKVTVEIDSDSFDTAKHKAARKIAKKVKVPGFRPGKAPYGVILRQVGEGYIVEQALDLWIEEQYPQLLKEAEIEAYGPGTLENVPTLDPPTLEFVIPLEPVVELGDYKSISIPYEPPATEDDEVESTIKRIQEQHAARESVDRPAEIGDVVYMRISGKRTDMDEGEDATIEEERFSSSTIKTELDPNEWPFPGFSTNLVGLSAEEEKTVSYYYPEEHEDENLQGAAVDFQVVVTNVQTLTLPEIDDELARTASEFDTLEEWKDDLRVNLEAQAQTAYAEEFDEKVIDQVVSDSVIKYPPQMIVREKEDILRGLEYRLSQQGLSKALYLQIRGIDEEGLDQEITPVAEDRVKRALVLMEVAKAEEIQPDPEMVQSEMGRTFEAISSSMTPNDAKKLAKSGYIPSLASNIVADLLTTTTVEYLRATARGEIWEPPYQPKDAESESGETDEDTATEEASPPEDTEEPLAESDESSEIGSEPEPDGKKTTELGTTEGTESDPTPPSD